MQHSSPVFTRGKIAMSKLKEHQSPSALKHFSNMSRKDRSDQYSNTLKGRFTKKYNSPHKQEGIQINTQGNRRLYKQL